MTFFAAFAIRIYQLTSSCRKYLGLRGVPLFFAESRLFIFVGFIGTLPFLTYKLITLKQRRTKQNTVQMMVDSILSVFSSGFIIVKINNQ